MRLESYRILSGWWVYRVISFHYVGCNAFESPMAFTHKSGDIFYRVYSGIDFSAKW